VYARGMQPSVQECPPLDKLYTSTLHLPNENIQGFVWRVEEMFRYGSSKDDIGVAFVASRDPRLRCIAIVVPP
jgi:hypothetical protein